MGCQGRRVFRSSLITTQYLNHCRPSNLSTPDLRDTEQLDRLSTPFNTVSHSLDVRRISRQRGYYNIPNIGIFFWRLQSLPRNCRAFDHGEGRFSFNQLGYDEPLFNHRKLEIDDSGVAEEINISAPIRMRAMDQSVSSYYYDNSIGEKGETDQKSLQITVDGSIKSQSFDKGMQPNKLGPPSSFRANRS